MDLAALLLQAQTSILEDAHAALERSHVRHYQAAGEEFTRQRLDDLFTLVVSAIRDRDLAVAVCAQCTVTDPVVGGLALINGNPLPQAPKWVHNLTARWGIPAGDGAEFYVFTDWAYRSEVNFFLYESKEFTGKSSLEGGLRLGYNWNQGDYGVAVFGRNITNQTRIVGGIDFNNLTGFINEPRTVGLEFSARF